MGSRPSLGPAPRGKRAPLVGAHLARLFGGPLHRVRALGRSLLGAPSTARPDPPLARAINCVRGPCYVEERDAVARVARALVAPVELAQVAQTVVEQGGKTLGVDSVALWLADEEAQELRLIAQYGFTPPRAADFERIPYSAGLLTTRAATSGQIQEIEDVRAAGPELKVSRTIAAQDATRSILAVPLHARGRLVGVMTCTRKEPHRYSEGERGLAITLADLFAAAIERAQLAQAREDSVLRRLQSVLDGIGRITAPAEASLEGVLREIATVARDLVAARYAALLLCNEDGTLDLFIPVGMTDEEIRALGPYPQGHGLLGALLRECHPIRLKNLRDDPRSVGFPPNHPAMTSLLGVAIRYQGKLLGGLYLADRLDGDEFTEEDCRAIEMLAAHAAVAIENARLYGKVRDALRLREEFLSAAAHELKTPVTALRGYAQILRGLPDNGSPLERQAREAIHHSSERIARLIHGLLEVSALDAGRLRLHRTTFDLTELAREVIADVQFAAPRHRLRLCSPGPAVVFADRDRIAEVLAGLLDNAVKFSPRDEVIDLTIDAASPPHGREVVVGVHDHGAGIPADRQPHVFEPLYEPQPSGAPGYVGIVGLGLYLGKRIVEEHGGRIWFETGDGKGTTFRVALPAAR